MCACAGSLTRAFRLQTSPNAEFQVCLLWHSGSVRSTRDLFSSISPARSGWTAPGKTRVHEHAETGKPGNSSDEDESRSLLVPHAANGLHGARTGFRRDKPDSDRAVWPCMRARGNGLAGNDSGNVGHKLSATGSPHHSTRSACNTYDSPRFSPSRGWH